MSSPAPNRRRFLSTTAIVLGIAAVAAATVSFFAGDPWALRITALVLIIIALGVARVSRRQPPPAEPD